MEEKNYEAIVEAILFTMGESVELEKIAAALELDKKETKKIIENLMKEYEKPSIGMKIIELDGAYQMCTKSEMYEYLIRIAKQPKKHGMAHPDTLFHCSTYLSLPGQKRKLPWLRRRGR